MLDSMTQNEQFKTKYLSLYRWHTVKRGVVANVLDCDILVSEFELQLHHNIHFRTNTLEKGMNPIIPVAMG